MLDAYLPVASVGAYTLNLGLWALGFSLLNGWLETFTRPVLYSHASAGEMSSLTTLIATRVGLCAAATLVALATLPLFGLSVVNRFVGSAYALEAPTQYLLVAAGGLQATGFGLVAGLLALKRGLAVALATTVAAVVNIAGSVITVPVHGVNGAAAANLAAYLVWNCVLATILVLATHRSAFRCAGARL